MHLVSANEFRTTQFRSDLKRSDHGKKLKNLKIVYEKQFCEFV